MIERLCIIGVGLIGGSLARALRGAGYCEHIVGAGRSSAHLQKALDLGVIDSYETDLARAVSGADMVLVAVPLGAMQSIFSAIKGRLADNAVLTDAGSAKGSVLDDAQRVFGKVPGFFVPGHPIAGTEQSGVEASFADLYRGRRVILTPVERTDAQATGRVRGMWEAAGAEVVEMDPQHHDAVLAATSHLPHVLAFTLVDSLVRMTDQQELFEYAAGGFRDFTRIASSDPVMWRDICLANHGAIESLIGHFISELKNVQQAVQAQDGDRLLECFANAKQTRDRFVDEKDSTPSDVD
ncbi:MAG: prephenate dehydrogenase/arogenate dehydrogenase family protein [Gammaproteobacteria bacterium]